MRFSFFPCVSMTYDIDQIVSFKHLATFDLFLPEFRHNGLYRCVLIDMMNTYEKGVIGPINIVSKYFKSLTISVQNKCHRATGI